MKKKIIVLFILIAQIATVSAQNYKFGKVSKEELEEGLYFLFKKWESRKGKTIERWYFSRKNK